jgi:hypothetical protein
VADGYEALWSNTTGNYNTATGLRSLYANTTGNNDTAYGVNALNTNTNGSGNTAIGFGALGGNTSGSQNVALGYDAGIAITTGSYNITIFDQGNSSDNNTIRIGTQGTQTSTYIAGIYGATASGGCPVYANSAGQLGVICSSRRYKDDIQSMANTSDVLLSLRPVTFRYKPELDPKGIPQFGLVAEEVDQVDPDLVVRDDQHGIYTVRYEAVNAMLLNEFQKEHRKVETQHTEIQELKQSVAELKAMVEKLAGK